MEDNGKILFHHDDQIFTFKILKEMVILCGIIFVPVFVIYNNYQSLFISIPIIIALGLFFIIILELDYAAEKKFSVTNEGIIIPVNTLYPIYKNKPQTEFIRFSKIKKIIHERGLSFNIKMVIDGRKDHYMFLNLYELKAFKKILQDKSIENNIRVWV